jgi:hypothetical protein
MQNSLDHAEQNRGAVAGGRSAGSGRRSIGGALIHAWRTSAFARRTDIISAIVQVRKVPMGGSGRLEARCPATGLALLQGKPIFERSRDGRMKVEMRLVRLKTHRRLGAVGSGVTRS